MKLLIESLKKETQSLKEQYINKTAEWADFDYDRMIERLSRYEKLSISDYSSKSEYYEEQKWFHRNIGTRYVNKEKFIEKKKKDAEIHYNNSIEKLAFRIEKKSLTEDKIKMTTSHVGVNIDTVITDGDKTVRAFTVLAWGPIQRPHYRYLIK